MNTKVLFLLMVAAGCATVAAVAGSQMMNGHAAAVPETPMVDIVVASADVNFLAKIKDDKFKLEKWPLDRLPQGAVKSMKEVEGKFTNQRMYAGEPLLEGKVMNSSDSVALKIPEGYKVFDLPIGSSGYIKPGDRVDVFGYFEKSSTISTTRSIRVMENVTVLMVDGVSVRDSEDSSKGSAKTVQLLIKASQYEALTTAANLGKMRLALRGMSNDEEQQDPDNGEEFLAWVQDNVRKASSPTDGAPSLPERPVYALNTEIEEPVAPREHVIVVYSGSQAREFRFKENELPMETSASAKPAPVVSGETEKSAPPGKFTGDNLRWDSSSGDWQKAESKASDQVAEPFSDGSI